MKKIFAVAALLILTGSTFAQTKWAAEDMGKTYSGSYGFCPYVS